ncbi:MAG: sialidase family protein [Armatimonadota bacterium]
MQTTTGTPLRIGEGAWTFLNGAWTEEPDGELAPPDGTAVEYIAVREDAVYRDFTARFRFKLRGITTVRFLFRLQDSRRFYALEIPFGGQQFRSRACWAGMVIADGTPLQRYLNFGLVPGLCACLGQWYEARVEAAGSRLRAWINDILVADVEDATYHSGRVGLASIQTPYIEAPRIDQVTIDGEGQSLTDWPGLQSPAPHWITPCPEVDPASYQSYAGLITSLSGEAVLYLTFGNPNYGEMKRAVLIRSRDGGKTWGQPEPATLGAGFGGPFVRRDGAWVCVHSGKRNPDMGLHSYESTDEGRTWSGPHELHIAGGWPGEWQPVSIWPAVRMRDGVLVLPIICAVTDEPKALSTQLFCSAMVLHSKDDGRTWSAPVLCDADARDPSQPPSLLRYAGRFYEVAMDEADPGVLVGIGRPDRDPYMWQLRSEDGGRTWEPAAIGHFPGFCPSLTRTASGALVATTRYPHFTARVSRDNGRTGSLPVIIDYPAWANQRAVEIEPDVVLLTYMGHIMDPGQPDSRSIRLRVTGRELTLD